MWQSSKQPIARLAPLPDGQITEVLKQVLKEIEAEKPENVAKRTERAAAAKTKTEVKPPQKKEIKGDSAFLEACKPFEEQRKIGKISLQEYNRSIAQLAQQFK